MCNSTLAAFASLVFLPWHHLCFLPYSLFSSTLSLTFYLIFIPIHNFDLLAEPLPAKTTAKAQTVKQLPTTKTAQNKEVLTTPMAPTKEDVKKTKSSNGLVEIGLPVLYVVCGAFTGIQFL